MKAPQKGAFDVKVDYIGSSRQPVVVIDDFLAEPGFWVEYAATQVAYHSDASYYPGIRGPAPREYGNCLYDFLGELVHKVFEWNCDPEITACTFSLMTTRPEDLRPNQRVPHVDFTHLNGLAVLHYLCTPKHGGTAFYRHRSTGYEMILDNNVHDFVNTINAEARFMGAPPPKYFDGSTPQFECIASYPAVFNRVLIYRGSILHSGVVAEGFSPDPNPRTGRLTVNTFFRKSKPAVARPV